MPGALALGAIFQRLFQQALPEPLRPLGIVRRKLDEGHLRTGHLSNLLSMMRGPTQESGPGEMRSGKTKRVICRGKERDRVAG